MSVPISRLGIFLIVGVFSFINIFVFYNFVNQKYFLSGSLFKNKNPMSLRFGRKSLNIEQIYTSKTVSGRLQTVSGVDQSNKSIINMFDSMNYLIKTGKKCSKKNSKSSTMLMVICVCSAVSNFQNRHAIRQTWGSQTTLDDDSRVIVVFFVGRTLDSHLQARLENESIAHDDIVQMDYLDTYQNLTLKSIAMLRWLNSHCSNVTFFIKIDDDCFLNLPFLKKELKKNGITKKLIMGSLMRRGSPIRDKKSKYFVPITEYRWKIYPNYVSGSCYVLSGDIAEKMYSSCLSLPFMSMEDIFLTGICAQKIGVAPLHNSHFVHWKLPANGCDFRDKIMGHFMKSFEFYKVWQDMLKLRQQTYKCVLKPKTLLKTRKGNRKG